MVDEEAPDCMVIAIGGHSIIPDLHGVDKIHVISAVDALYDSSKVTGDNVVVIGGGDVGCETAAYLAQQGKKVTIVEMLNELMDDEIINVKIVLEKIMRELNIEVYLGSKVEAITDDTVIISGKSGVREIVADSVVLSLGIEEQNEDVRALECKCADVHILGDCIKAGRIRDAVRDGDLVGRLI